MQKTISNNVTAFNVVIDNETGVKNTQKYNMLHTDIPLVIKYSPFREIVGPLVEFIESAEYGLTDCDIVSVILPQFIVQKFLAAHFCTTIRVCTSNGSS